MGVANQCATKIGSLFVFSKGMFFFFRLDTKEKEPKRKSYIPMWKKMGVEVLIFNFEDCVIISGNFVMMESGVWRPM